MASKSTGGRKKTQKKRVENDRERGVTLSKRHSGVFKKASELATLCGAQIMIIVFTMTGKPLSFGSPGVRFVTDKFLNSSHVDHNPHDFRRRFAYSCNEMKLQSHNQEFNELNEKMKIEKKQGEILEEVLKAFLDGKTYEKYVRSIGVDELMQVKYKVEVLNRNLKCSHSSTSGSASSSDHEYQLDLSKIGGPKDYLKL